MSATAEDEDFATISLDEDVTTPSMLEDDVFEMEESGPGTEAEVTVDDEVEASTGDEAGMIFDEFEATFHEFEAFSSVQAVKASTPTNANNFKEFINAHPF